MLTDEQLRIGFTHPAIRWPSGEVPFVIDSVFSEYCSTNVQSATRGLDGNINLL